MWMQLILPKLDAQQLSVQCILGEIRIDGDTSPYIFLCIKPVDVR